MLTYSAYTDSQITINGQPLNPHLSSSGTLTVEVGPREINAPTAALDHIFTKHPRVANPDQASQCIVGRSIIADAGAVLKNGETQRSVWGLNIQARVGPGEYDNPAGKYAALDHCGIEVDLINEFEDSPESVNEAGHSYGFWAQADSATGRKNGTAFFATDTGAGWINGVHIDARVHGWLSYLKTHINAPKARGQRIETQWADESGTILELVVAGITKFRVSGAVGISTGTWLWIDRTLKQIEYGAPDSAGPGYRALKVAN